MKNIKEEKRYFKKEILKSEKYKRRKDLVEAILEDDLAYTLKEVDIILDRYLGGRI